MYSIHIYSKANKQALKEPISMRTKGGKNPFTLQLPSMGNSLHLFPASKHALKRQKNSSKTPKLHQIPKENPKIMFDSFVEF